MAAPRVPLTSGLRILELGREADEHWRLHPYEAFAIEWAALAATTHDLTGLWKETKDKETTALLEALRPSFRRDPVSYLLALADNLQDFDRLNLRWKAGSAPSNTEITACHVYQAVELQVDGGRAKATFHLSRDAAGPGSTEDEWKAEWEAATRFKGNDERGTGCQMALRGRRLAKPSRLEAIAATAREGSEAPPSGPDG